MDNLGSLLGSLGLPVGRVRWLFGRPLGRFVGAFGNPWRTLLTSGSTGQHLQGALSSFWETVAAKAMVLRETLGELWKYFRDFLKLGRNNMDPKGTVGRQLQRSEWF